MITEKQRAQRARFIGSSDIPAIVGLDPWRGPGDVYLEKTQMLTENPEPSAAVQVGQRLERTLAGWAAESLGLACRRNVRRVHKQFSFLAANLDAVLADKSVLEIKTSARGEEWGEPHEGSAALPPRVLAQVYFQIQVAESPRAYVGALLSGRGGFRFNVYRVEPAPDIQTMLEQKAVEFWNSFVIPRIPPPEAPRIDSLERMIREPGKRVEIAPALIEEYLAARERAKAALTTRAAAMITVMSLESPSKACLAGTTPSTIPASSEARAIRS